MKNEVYGNGAIESTVQNDHLFRTAHTNIPQQTMPGKMKKLRLEDYMRETCR